MIGETITDLADEAFGLLAGGSAPTGCCRRHASAIATRCASVGWLSRRMCAQAGGSGSPSDVLAKPTNNPRTAAGSRVVWSAFQSASDSMPRLIQALGGRQRELERGDDEQRERNRGRLSHASASPRRAHQHPGSGEREEAEPGEALRDVIARVVADLVGEHRPHLPSVNVPSTIVLQRTIFREAPKPTA